VGVSRIDPAPPTKQYSDKELDSATFFDVLGLRTSSFQLAVNQQVFYRLFIILNPRFEISPSFIILISTVPTSAKWPVS
jgi:hypothetical protein